mmetsp:Transcript_11640/g.17098  ORF Transcript_11640/g.17098 Transcript_11640/m.17098 type:complete len:108 (+) Transcript_11640:648-971(+)
MSVNFPALPHGETFLAASSLHSLEMMQMLLEKGADVNIEHEIMYECPIDVLLEIEEEDGELSEEEIEILPRSVLRRLRRLLGRVGWVVAVVMMTVVRETRFDLIVLL